MAQKTINLGNTDQGNGDPLRTAFGKVNDNFTELYTALGLGDTSLNLGSFEFTNNVMTTTDSSAVIIDQNVTITNELTMQGDIVPNLAGEHNLGSAAKPWGSLYVSGSTIYIGGNALGINDQGELTYNDNRVAHEAGEFMTLDNLSNVNSSNPSNGDVLTWAGSFWTHTTLASIGNLRVNSSAGATTIGTIDNPNTGGWGGYDLYIDSGFNSDAFIYIPGLASQAGSTNLQISNNSAAGSIQLFGRGGVQAVVNHGVNEKVFEFADNGTLIFPDGSLALTDSVLNNGLDADIKGSVFADDSTIMVDGVSGVLRANVNVANTWTVTTGNKTWSFIYGDVSEGTIPIFEFPGSLQASQSQTGIYAPADDLSGNWGMSIDAANSPYYVDIGEISGSNFWRFDDNGGITFPDTTVQTTAWTGVADIARNIENEGDVSIAVNLTDSTQRIWQFGEDGDFTIPGNLIYGGDTIHAKESTATAGNPLTVRAGDSETQNGGNLILRGGDTIGDPGTPRNGGWAVLRAGGTITGNGGYAELFGGTTVTGDGGQAYVSAGSSVTGNGGTVEITAGDTVTGNGGDVVIESGEAVTGTAGNINITAKDTVTGDGGNINLTGGSATSGNGGAINLTAGDTIGSGDPGTIRLRTFNAAAPQDWTFNFNGTLTFPDATTQSTAYTGTANNIENEGDVNIRVNLTDSTTRIWRFGEDGDLAFPDGTTQTTAYTGNAATVDIMNTNGIDYNYSITFVENRSATQDLRADVDLTFNSWSNTLTAGNVTTGILRIEDGAHEKFQAKADATGTVTHNCALGHVFYHTSPDANWTANFTNLNLDSGYATAVTLVIVQGGTGYYPSAVQIGGVGQTLNWQGNTTPTPSTNRTDVITFSIINNSGTYTVLGQLTGF